jgi:hypothetical protein
MAGDGLIVAKDDIERSSGPTSLDREAKQSAPAVEDALASPASWIREDGLRRPLLRSLLNQTVGYWNTQRGAPGSPFPPVRGKVRMGGAAGRISPPPLPSSLAARGELISVHCADLVWTDFVWGVNVMWGATN